MMPRQRTADGTGSGWAGADHPDWTKLDVNAVAQRAIDALASSPAKRIGVAFGSPYLLREVPSLPTYICAYGPQPVLQIAATRALFGETKMTGKLPVTIPGFYERGHGIVR